MVEELRPHRPGLVVCLGGQVASGDYAALLALRDAVDELGSRVVFIPGPAESGGWLGGARKALLGPTGRVYNGGGVSVIAVDVADGNFFEDRFPTADPFAMAPAGLGPKILAAFHPVLPSPDGEREGLRGEAREELLRYGEAAGVGLAIGATEGEGYVRTAPFGRQLALRYGPAGGEVALVRLTPRGFGTIEVAAVRRSSGLGAAVRHHAARVRAASAEHPGLGRRLALAVVGLVGVLVGFVLRLQRWRARAPDREAALGEDGAGLRADRRGGESIR
jgi:hypothetical protein